MTKEQARELMRLGLVVRLHAIEHELADWYRKFPDVFIGPPQLARPELRNGAAPAHWAGVVATKGTTKDTIKGKHGKGHGERVRANRRRSAATLDALAAVGRPVPKDKLHEIVNGGSTRVIGGLVRRGYVKFTKRGYVRTAKVFVVDTRKSATAP